MDVDVSGNSVNRVVPTYYFILGHTGTTAQQTLTIMQALLLNKQPLQLKLVNSREILAKPEDVPRKLRSSYETTQQLFIPCTSKAFQESLLHNSLDMDLISKYQLKQCFVKLRRLSDEAIQSHPIDNLIQNSDDQRVEYFSSKTNRFLYKKPKPRSDEILRCASCDQTFPSMLALGKHVQLNHIGKDRLQCYICNKRYAFRRVLRNHVITIHMYPYRCKYCGRNFTDRCVMEEHARTHQQEKYVYCETCAKYYIRECLRHKTNNSVECEICHRQCESAYYLDIHIEYMHSGTSKYSNIAKPGIEQCFVPEFDPNADINVTDDTPDPLGESIKLENIKTESINMEEGSFFVTPEVQLMDEPPREFKLEPLDSPISYDAETAELLLNQESLELKDEFSQGPYPEFETVVVKSEPSDMLSDAKEHVF